MIMPDVFFTENLSIHRKILIGLKDQFDLHKLLQFFHDKTLWLVFLLMILGDGLTNSYFDD